MFLSAYIWGMLVNPGVNLWTTSLVERLLQKCIIFSLSFFNFFSLFYKILNIFDLIKLLNIFFSFVSTWILNFPQNFKKYFWFP